MQGIRVSRWRDLILVQEDAFRIWIIACDSLGGIGPQPEDVYPASAKVVGRACARVVLMEILAAGGTPVVLVDTLGVSMEPYGREILAGIHEELERCGLGGKVAVTGSTEENVWTKQTFLGVTGLGLASPQELRLGRTALGDLVLVAGVPKSASMDHVDLDDPDVANPTTIQRLLALDAVHEILPVGSRGIRYEAEELAHGAGGVFVPLPSPSLDLGKSAGPSTCVLVTVPEDAVDPLSASLSLPCHVVGSIRERELG
ncbi:MAG: AIR synthase related protein [Armatimonadota bacterium]|nr:AIR synthase related protein [Armatimonadota bacterium]MDR5702764.1 AIR synthase related protein [Armatimonadota bacterium]